MDEAIGLMPKFPSPSPVLKNLTFTYEEKLSRDGEFGGSDFGGYPTLRQRNDSFNIRESMCVHCGYVCWINHFSFHIFMHCIIFFAAIICLPSNAVCFSSPFTHICPFCIFNDA